MTIGYDFETFGLEEFTETNYAKLYGVKPEESDFSGSIERSLKEGIKHLDGNFVHLIETLK